MTSTTGGADAPSFGWIGRAAITARQKQPHINVFGGEDRFWLGPEGGQFSLYFKQGDPFDLDHWQVPEAIDWGKWDVDSQSADAVRFRKRMSLVNYSGTPLEIEVDRTIRLLGVNDFATLLGVRPDPGYADGGIRVFQHRDQCRPRAVADEIGARIDMDPRHVYAVARHHDRDSVRARA